MGAICEYCKKDMLEVEGCLFTHFQTKENKIILRSLDSWQESGQRCGDCGAFKGKPHHLGCDVERCPICGGQAIGCDCLDDAMLLRIKKLTKERGDI